MALFQHLRRVAVAATPLRPHASVLQFSSLGRSPSASAFGGAQPEGATALSTQFSVRNGSAVPGRLMLQLPLPGIAGLSPIQVNDATQTVQSVIESIKKADASLKSVEITTTNGTKLARTVQLRELTNMEFILRLNHVNILVQNGKTDAHRLAVCLCRLG